MCGFKYECHLCVSVKYQMYETDFKYNFEIVS